MHRVLFLHQEDQFLTAERIDEIGCAELPDSRLDESGELFAVINSCMIDGPCESISPTSPYMQSSGTGTKICRQLYRKEFQTETQVQEDGYPVYR